MPGQQQQQQLVFASGPPSGSNLNQNLSNLAVQQQQQMQMPYGQPPPPPQQQQQQQLIKGELMPVALPTREQLIALGNDPDSFSYTYGAMKKTSFGVLKRGILKILEEANVKNSPSLMADLARDGRGPRVVFQMFQVCCKGVITRF
jgi:hypothetical protein